MKKRGEILFSESSVSLIRFLVLGVIKGEFRKANIFSIYSIWLQTLHIYLTKIVEKESFSGFWILLAVERIVSFKMHILDRDERIWWSVGDAEIKLKFTQISYTHFYQNDIDKNVNVELFLRLGMFWKDCKYTSTHYCYVILQSHLPNI